MLANAVAQGAVCGLELQTPFYSMGDAVSALIPRQNGGAFDSAVAGVLAAFEMQSCSTTARDHEPRMLANAVGRAAPCVCHMVCVCALNLNLCVLIVCVCALVTLGCDHAKQIKRSHLRVCQQSLLRRLD